MDFVAVQRQPPRLDAKRRSAEQPVMQWEWTAFAFVMDFVEQRQHFEHVVVVAAAVGVAAFWGKL